jgi:CheY-like chemotaxis protein
MTAPSSTFSPRRVFCLEDNPLIVFHLEHMIEDLGHIFAGSAESFADLRAEWMILRMDCALIDIDLADGRTGPEAAVWLAARNVPAIFVTGQESVAAEHAKTVSAIVSKPVSQAALFRGSQHSGGGLAGFAAPEGRRGTSEATARRGTARGCVRRRPGRPNRKGDPSGFNQPVRR